MGCILYCVCCCYLPDSTRTHVIIIDWLQLLRYSRYSGEGGFPYQKQNNSSETMQCILQFLNISMEWNNGIGGFRVYSILGNTWSRLIGTRNNARSSFWCLRFHSWWHVLSSDHIVKSISLVEVNQAIFVWSFCENPMPENQSGTMYLPV